jgi:hypothetical protein
MHVSSMLFINCNGGKVVMRCICILDCVFSLLIADAQVAARRPGSSSQLPNGEQILRLFEFYFYQTMFAYISCTVKQKCELLLGNSCIPVARIFISSCICILNIIYGCNFTPVARIFISSCKVRFSMQIHDSSIINS